MIMFVQNFTSIAMRAISDSCPNLKVLSIIGELEYENQGIFSINDNDLAYFSQRCPMIWAFQILRAPLITNVAVKNMVQRFSSLTNLLLGGCPLLTDSAVIAIAEYSLNLTLFAIMGNANITDVSIIKLSESCKKLTELVIIHCQQISDAVLDKLGVACLQLKKLVCGHCPLITRGGMTRLKQRLPALVIENDFVNPL